VRNIYDEIQKLGGEVLGISFASPIQLAAFVRDAAPPFRVVSDPDRKAYQAFGLGQTNLGAFLRFGVVWHYLKLIFRGWMPRKPEGSDVWQLGGDFVLDRAGRLSFAHISQDATDRPSSEALLAALQIAAK
jgi:hypothetical protein